MSAPDTPPERDETLPEQGFMSHLIELRARLLKAIAAVLTVLLALVPFAGKLYSYLARSLVARMPQGAHLVAMGVASALLAPLIRAFFAALVSAMARVLYQLCAVVSPVVNHHEKRVA